MKKHLMGILGLTSLSFGCVGGEGLLIVFILPILYIMSQFVLLKSSKLLKNKNKIFSKIILETFLLIITFLLFLSFNISRYLDENLSYIYISLFILYLFIIFISIKYIFKEKNILRFMIFDVLSLSIQLGTVYFLVN